jgi:hypothetical protein
MLRNKQSLSLHESLITNGIDKHNKGFIETPLSRTGFDIRTNISDEFSDISK